jgi:type I restriction enzyme S subunit
MKKGWEYKKLGEVITDLRTGLNPRIYFKLNTEDSKGAYITVRELKGFNFEVDEKTDKINTDAVKRIDERSHLQIGDVLFSGTGTLGRTALVLEKPKTWNIKEGVYAITPNNEMLMSKFLIYGFMSKPIMNRIYDKASGATVKSIPMKNLREIIFPIPPLSEQQRIVSYLDSAFAKIDAVAKNAEDSLNEAKALFQSALTKMMEPKEGWEEVTLEEICTSVNYGTSKPSIENGKYKYLRMNNITNDGFLDLSHYKTITLSGKELDKSIVKRGDILFNRTNSRELVGKSCVFTDEEPMVIAGYLIRIKLKAGYDPQFITYNMNLQRSLGKFKGLIVGAVHQANISAKNIQTINIAVPSLSTQQSIVSTLDSLKSKVDQLQSNFFRTLAECAALKQSILRQTFE